MKGLKPHSLWLLRMIVERGGYCITNRLPCMLRDGTPEPLGLSMSTMRGLEKRGLVEERHSGIFFATDTGRLAAQQQDKTSG